MLWNWRLGCVESKTRLSAKLLAPISRYDARAPKPKLYLSRRSLRYAFASRSFDCVFVAFSAQFEDTGAGLKSARLALPVNDFAFWSSMRPTLIVQRAFRRI